MRALGIAAILGALPAVSEAACRVALLLAIDVSSSVDAGEHDLQRTGLAQALRHGDVQEAILRGPGHVALAVYEWSGRRQHRVVVDWTVLDGPDDIAAVAATVEAAPRSYAEFPTAMGYAMGFGHTLMTRAPDCARQVIDVSGDGLSNDGFGPQLAYKHFDFDAITVNGLAIDTGEVAVIDYYEAEVARGPLSFVEVARGFEDFERAMVRKLYRELSEIIVGEAR
ncbi:DUF1194 domain-containing protein [Roseobacteraceae bacterium S113]